MCLSETGWKWGESQPRAGETCGASSILWPVSSKAFGSLPRNTRPRALAVSCPALSPAPCSCTWKSSPEGASGTVHWAQGFPRVLASPGVSPGASSPALCCREVQCQLQPDAAPICSFIYDEAGQAPVFRQMTLADPQPADSQASSSGGADRAPGWPSWLPWGWRQSPRLFLWNPCPVLRFCVVLLCTYRYLPCV